MVVYSPMKLFFSSPTSILFAVSTIACLTGCEGYTYTLNEQPIFSTPETTLFSDYSLSDSSLQSCTEQAILDQSVTQPSQLTQLNCSNAGISNLNGLEIFSGLTHINLNGNKLIKIKPILYLSKLQVVTLEANKHLDCSQGTQLANKLKGSVKLPSHCL
jgi:Leucine-rich repeat (LRR) protein